VGYSVFASVTSGITQKSSSLGVRVIEESGAADESGVIQERLKKVEGM
jgi:hypothetical protein